MPSPSLPRRNRLPRLLALWLLLLAVVWQPVLASVGDIHEIGHGGAMHAVAEGDHANDAAHGDAGSPEEDGNLLHALMHAGHCCGHAVAMPAAVVARLQVFHAGSVPVLRDVVPSLAPRNHPFRPPIAV